MNRTHIVRSRHEKGWALVVVLVTSVVCISIAMALVANRQQALKLAGRQQQDQLATLESRIESDHVKGAITQVVKQQTGGVSTVAGLYNSTGIGSALSQASGDGSTMTDSNGNTTPTYQTNAQSSGSVISPVWQYTPQNASLFSTPLTADAGTVDSTDPLQGVQSASLVGALPVETQATPTSSVTNYVGQSTSTSYVFRDVPLSIYSLYGTGSSSVSADQLATGDAGRVYVNGNLTVNGQVNASRPLTAQRGIQMADNSAALTVDQSLVPSATGTATPPAAEQLTSTGNTQDQQQMTGGEQILTTGDQARSVQVLPTNNFGSTADSTLPQLGGQCEFQVSYTPPASDGSTPGQAQVSQQASDPNFPLSTLINQITQDSNTMNGPWDNPTLNLPQPPGYMAALTANGTRLMNAAGTAPKQFVVIDYSEFAALTPSAQSQTFYVQGDPNNQAVLIRGGVDSSGNGLVTAGFSVVTNLDIYVHQGLAPSSSTAAISLITSGTVYAAP